MLGLYKFDKLPQILSDKDYNKLNAPTFYRGAIDKEYHANLLCDYDYHCGIGGGIWASSTPNTANMYKYGQLKGDVLTFKFVGQSYYPKTSIKSELLDQIITFVTTPANKLKKPIKYFNQKDISRLEILRDYNQNLPLKQDKKTFEKIVADGHNHSFVSVFLGYDADYHRQPKQEFDEITIFNRSKIVISQSEFNRICEGSKNYQSGVIDFEKKTENDFLLE